MTFKKMVNQWQSIIDFNATIRNGSHIVDTKNIELQCGLVTEELKELRDAKDCIEWANELGDCFVTLSYYINLINDDFSHKFCYDVIERIVNGDINVAGHTIHDPLTKHNAMYKMGYVVEYVDTDVLQKIIDRNWTKLPTIESIDDPLLECEQLNEKYKTRYSNIVYDIVTDSNGVKRYAFRTDYGTGKLVKPLKFV